MFSCTLMIVGFHYKYYHCFNLNGIRSIYKTASSNLKGCNIRNLIDNGISNLTLMSAGSRRACVILACFGILYRYKPWYQAQVFDLKPLSCHCFLLYYKLWINDCVNCFSFIYSVHGYFFSWIVDVFFYVFTIWHLRVKTTTLDLNLNLWNFKKYFSLLSFQTSW